MRFRRHGPLSNSRALGPVVHPLNAVFNPRKHLTHTLIESRANYLSIIDGFTRLYPNPPIHGCCAALCRHAGPPVAAPQTSSLPSRQPSTHRTGTVSLATPAIGGFGLYLDAPIFVVSVNGQWYGNAL